MVRTLDLDALDWWAYAMDAYVNPVSAIRNWTFIAIVVVANSFGNLMLAIGTKQLPAFDLERMPEYLVGMSTNFWIIGGVALLASYMFAQLSMLSWCDLSYVLPVTAIGYIITALLAVFVLGENISPMRWAGTAVISFGVFFVAETGEKTIHKPAARDGSPAAGIPQRR